MKKWPFASMIWFGLDNENIYFAFVNEKSGQLKVWFGLDIENMKQMFTGWWFGLVWIL